jgi:hypothetical protein
LGRAVAKGSQRRATTIDRSLDLSAFSEPQNRVRVPDGRVGTVLGYYRREEETVLVKFTSGASREFLSADVEELVVAE